MRLTLGVPLESSSGNFTITSLYLWTWVAWNNLEILSWFYYVLTWTTDIVCMNFYYFCSLLALDLTNWFAINIMLRYQLSKGPSQLPAFSRADNGWMGWMPYYPPSLASETHKHTDTTYTRIYASYKLRFAPCNTLPPRLPHWAGCRCRPPSLVSLLISSNPVTPYAAMAGNSLWYV